MSNEPVPQFASEQEEANWWDAHPEALTLRFEKARLGGKVKRLSQTNLPGASDAVTIQLPEQELSRVRQFANQRGLGYQTYLKRLLHEALDAEEKRLAS
jgi:predicted DNA binding CopG/RHH family protein